MRAVWSLTSASLRMTEHERWLGTSTSHLRWILYLWIALAVVPDMAQKGSVVFIGHVQTGTLRFSRRVLPSAIFLKSLLRICYKNTGDSEHFPPHPFIHLSIAQGFSFTYSHIRAVHLQSSIV